MSYWVRTMILTPKDHKEREKYMNKFVKIMKVTLSLGKIFSMNLYGKGFEAQHKSSVFFLQQLRRMNNFNSYLAILSALDSSMVRRLDWSKSCMEQLKVRQVY